MIGPALNHDVTRLHYDLPIIHEQCDLSLQNDAVVNRLSAVHVGMTRTGARVRRGVDGTDFREQCLRLRLIHSAD
jgi:hypothetical protein